MRTSRTTTGIHSRLNWLRAGVLGANDGIVSTAGIVMGVAGATSDRGTILIAGVAGLVAGALSMARRRVRLGQHPERLRAGAAGQGAARAARRSPQEELEELAGLYVDKGLTEELALEVARQLTEHDALGAHAEAELGIDPDDITSPWNAALASMVAFTVGALLPLLTITLVSRDLRIGSPSSSVAVALALTGWASARFGYGPAGRAVLRNVAGGLFAMAVTYVIGSALGAHV